MSDDFTNRGHEVSDKYVGGLGGAVGDIHQRLAEQSGLGGAKQAITETTTRGAPAEKRPEREEKCTGCGQLILGAALQVGGRYYHSKCFACAECSKALSGEFVQAGDFPYCKPCGVKKQELAAANRAKATKNAAFGGKESNAAEIEAQRRRNEALKANANKGKENCAKCGAAFKATDFNVVEFGGGTLHAACFTCAKCNKNIDGEYSVRDGTAVCGACAKAGASSNNCGGCGKPVTSGAYLKAGDKMYHKDCFKCNFCKAPLTGGFAIVQGAPACGTCAAKNARPATVTRKIVAGAGRKDGFVIDPKTGKKRTVANPTG